MPDTNKTNHEPVNDDLGKAEMDQQLQSGNEDNANDQDDNPLTHSDDETSDANQANAAGHAIGETKNNSALRYADRNRSTSSRANEATDRNDTNTGGLGSGGGNSAGEIM